MSNERRPESERILTAHEDDPDIVWDRCGGRCYICREIVHHRFEGTGIFSYPLYPDFTPDKGITICPDCFMSHTFEQLDEYVEEMQERQRALEDDRGDYATNQELAFERDSHTCQLCGKEGIPKAERGLIAYPVCAGDYHLDNLVTICNDCLTDTLDSDEDERTAAERLRLRATRAKEWINHDAEPPEYLRDKNDSGETDPES